MTESRGMRVYALVIGTRGDLEVCRSVCNQLAASGHAVTIATHDFYRPLIEAPSPSGIDFASISGSGLERLRTTLQALSGDPMQRTREYFARWVQPELENSMSRVARAVNKADYFLSNLKIVFRRANGTLIPTARLTYDLPPSATELARYQPICDEVLDLVCFEYDFVKSFGSWRNERLRFTGFWNPVPSNDHTVPFAASDILTRNKQCIVVAMGSMAMANTQTLVDKVVEANEARHPIIVVGGWSSEDQSRHADVLFVSDASYSQLFPHAKCVIHHGGYGTMVSATLAGTTQIIYPQIICQQQLAKLAVHHRIASGIITDETGVHELKQLLASDELTSQTARQRWKERLETADGAKTAAQWIEKHFQSLTETR